MDRGDEMTWRKIGTIHKKVEVKPEDEGEIGWQKIGMVQKKIEAASHTRSSAPRLEAQITDYGGRFRAMIVDGSGKSVMRDLPSLKKAKAWADTKMRAARNKGWVL